MADSSSDPRVLIVGAGPGGLFAACELTRYGVKPCIVERRLAPHHETRGAALQPAVLGLIGFRAARADASTMAALDAHLSSYLIAAGA
jgi:2-polyprenyl-6-methoxyphenol hydroxylase-like FAD-dependent oxidoreductase